MAVEETILKYQQFMKMGEQASGLALLICSKAVQIIVYMIVQLYRIPLNLLRSSKFDCSSGPEGRITKRMSWRAVKGGHLVNQLIRSIATPSLSLATACRTYSRRLCCCFNSHTTPVQAGKRFPEGKPLGLASQLVGAGAGLRALRPASQPRLA